jgi:formylglycine-generating enzyme required for sulfatase activity
MNSYLAPKTVVPFVLILLGSWSPSASLAAELAVPATGPHGLEFVRIDAGRFTMGADLAPGYITAERPVFIQDEFPIREVRLTAAYEMSRYEVTNAQYERYDPSHAAWRGKARGLSSEDREPVVYVGWKDAVGFCRWLSGQDPGNDYRLPTEAEWEYACRAGTRTPYNDGIEGDILSMNPLGPLAARWRVITQWFVTRGNRPAADIAWDDVQDVDLSVGQQGPNAWGLYDMHGGVEEWTGDWYGPYVASDSVDPVGYVDGIARVVRGGSHGVQLQTLRSANRSAALVSDKHFLLGFRVVRVPKGRALPAPTLRQPVKAWARDVSQRVHHWRSDTREAHFDLESLYEMRSAYGSAELAGQFQIPLYTHNHSPSLTWAPNGDVLMVWFSDESEKDQALTILALRGRRQPDGSLIWDREVSEFFKAADRNMHGSQVWNNARRIAKGLKEPFTLYHINGICTDGKWSRLAMSIRKSTDNGATWTEPTIIKQDTDALHLESARNQPQGDVTVASDGAFLSFSDGSVPGGSGSTVNWSGDGGETWSVRTAAAGPPGIHIASEELTDGRILAFSRDAGKTFGTMPKSLSTDQGKTWTSGPSPFPWITFRQRPVLLRLEYSLPALDPQGRGRRPLLLISIAIEGIEGRDANGKDATIQGTFAALSWDEGETWPIKRVLSDVRSGSQSHVMAPWDQPFTLDATHGQPQAYWEATQTPDGIVHLSDGRLYYAFNLAWLAGGSGSQRAN